MKRLSRAVIFILALFLIIPLEAGAVQLLVPGGQLIGLELSSDAVTVAAFDDTFGHCAREAGLQIGDRILAVDGKEVSSAEDSSAFSFSAGDTSGEEFFCSSCALSSSISCIIR